MILFHSIFQKVHVEHESYRQISIITVVYVTSLYR